eukprot:GILI01012097.1.p1 GENE.GILI01012097.1~~GILI01012097.1.p1  ORF type:complete len:760 (+),score=148.53 GILI01012097.1:122-2401(+)
MQSESKRSLGSAFAVGLCAVAIARFLRHKQSRKASSSQSLRSLSVGHSLVSASPYKDSDIFIGSEHVTMQALCMPHSHIFVAAPHHDDAQVIEDFGSLAHRPSAEEEGRVRNRLTTSIVDESDGIIVPCVPHIDLPLPPSLTSPSSSSSSSPSSSSSSSSEKEHTIYAEVLKTPLLKTPCGELVAIRSGMRSALIYRHGSWFRLKGCGNTVQGFPLRPSQFPPDAREIRGCQFEATAAREMHMSALIHAVLSQQGLGACGNKPVGVWQYPSSSPPQLQDDPFCSSLQWDLPSLPKFCGVFETLGEKRLATHLLSGLEMLLLSLCPREVGEGCEGVVADLVGAFPAARRKVDIDSLRKSAVSSSSSTPSSTATSSASPADSPYVTPTSASVRFRDSPYTNGRPMDLHEWTRGGVYSDATNELVNLCALPPAHSYRRLLSLEAAGCNLFNFVPSCSSAASTSTVSSAISSDPAYAISPQWQKLWLEALSLLHSHTASSSSSSSSFFSSVFSSSASSSSLLERVKGFFSSSSSSPHPSFVPPSSTSTSTPSVPPSISELMALIFWRVGYEVGRIKRVLQDADISWGYFVDHNPFEPHCNSHPNNLVVVHPRKFNGFLLAPVDFDMAFTWKGFINTQEPPLSTDPASPPSQAQVERAERERFELFQNWLSSERFAMEQALAGMENMANFSYRSGNNASASSSAPLPPSPLQEAVRVGLRDTLVSAYRSGFDGCPDLHPLDPSVVPCVYALITLALILTDSAVA